MAGIDQQIQTKVDAYRNNPQALQERYAQNQQLVDLLALQRLKTELDEKQRAVQMQMQQNPETIKQQRERELFDRTKEDMLKQQGGIMATAQQRQQQNMQQVAQEGAASPRQVQQVASGLGALAQRQAPQRMAAGGVVALQAGGEITQEMIDAYRRRLGQRSVNSRLTDEEVLAILQAERGITPAPVEDTLAVQDEAVAAVEDEPVGIETLSTEPQPGSSMAPIGFPTITAPEIDTSKVGTLGKQINEQFGLGGANANNAQSAMNTARDDAAKFLGREEKASKYEDLTSRLEAFDAEYSDPKRQRERGISAFLRGTAGGGSFGQTMAGGSEAMAAEEDKQYTDRRQRLEDIIGLNKEAITTDVAIGSEAQRSGTSAADRAAANARQAADIAAGMSKAEMDQAFRVADMKLQSDKANLDAIVQKARVEADRDVRLAIEAASNQQATYALLERNTQRQAEISQEVMADQEYLMLLDRAAQTGDPADIAKAEAKQKQLTMVANIIMSQAGLFDVDEQLYKRLGRAYNRPGGKRNNAEVPSDSDVGVPSDVQALVNQYTVQE